MCIAVYSHVPLAVQLLYEQIWCRPAVDELCVQECYDLVIANHGGVSTDTMTLISPHVLFDPETDNAGAKPQIKLPARNTTPDLDWYMFQAGDPLTGPHVTKEQIAFQVPRYRHPGAEPEYFPFSCVPLEGDVQFHTVLRCGSPSLWKEFVNLKCTVAELRFARPIEPFAKSKQTYWLRIVLEPVRLNHRVSTRVLLPVKNGGTQNTSGVRVQPCEIMAPNVVFYKMRSLFARIRDMKGNSSEIQDLERAFVTDGFDGDGSVSWIEDHRISVVTDTDALVIDSQKLGAVAFHRVEPAGKPELHAWTWNAGMQHFPWEDAFQVVCRVFSYLVGKAEGQKKACSVERIMHETGLPRSNARFALEVLVKERVLAAHHGGYYLAKHTEHLTDLKTEAEIRTAMAKSVDLGNGPVRFPGKSFLVQFSLLWTA